jgi:hypothetical protein
MEFELRRRLTGRAPVRTLAWLPQSSCGYVRPMTSPEPSNETDEVLTTPATPGAEALPTTEDDEGDDTRTS